MTQDEKDKLGLGFAQADDDTQPEDALDHARTPVHPRRDGTTPSAAAVHAEKPDIQWAPPQTLDAPPPRPGMTQRWIRSRTGAEYDLKNWSRKMREGWVPRDPATMPKEYADLPKGKLQLGSGNSVSVITIEGMVLCEMPMERKRKRDRFYADRAASLMEAVNVDLNKTQSQGGIPINRRARTQVKVGPHAAMPDRADGDDV